MLPGRTFRNVERRLPIASRRRISDGTGRTDTAPFVFTIALVSELKQSDLPPFAIPVFLVVTLAPRDPLTQISPRVRAVESHPIRHAKRVHPSLTQSQPAPVLHRNALSLRYSGSQVRYTA